jgi:hypothetical protein
MLMRILRRLTLTLTTLVLLVTILSTWALQYLPDEPLHLRRNLTLYAAFVIIVSGLGLLGGIQVWHHYSLQTYNRRLTQRPAQRNPHKPLRFPPPPRRPPLLHPPCPPPKYLLPTPFRPLHNLTTPQSQRHQRRCRIQCPK